MIITFKKFRLSVIQENLIISSLFIYTVFKIRIYILLVRVCINIAALENNLAVYISKVLNLLITI